MVRLPVFLVVGKCLFWRTVLFVRNFYLSFHGCSVFQGVIKADAQGHVVTNTLPADFDNMKACLCSGLLIRVTHETH